MRIGPWPCLAALVMASAAITAQGQRPSFKAGVELVRIDVSVLDGNRQPVRGLRASDFTLLEDGEPRPIRAFNAIDHAATPAAGATASVETTTGVATNQASNDTSRLILILMDRSIPPERPTILARQIADAAVEAMAPGDLAAIVTTGSGLPQNLTSDRARLHKTIAGSDWSHRLSQAQLDDPIITLSGIGDPMQDGACLCGLCAMDTITQLAYQVRDVARPKLLLFIGSDITVQVGMGPGALDRLGCDKLARDSREKLFAALATSGLTVHSIDPQGLVTVGPQTRATVVNGIENRTPADLRQQLTGELNDFMKAQGNLAVLPELTGGRTILNTNEPFRVVPDILHESDAYYVLAFEPSESTGDVRHKIEVKVARKGVHVHSVRSIDRSTATPDAAPLPRTPLERALTDLLPDASPALGMAVSTFAGPDRRHAYVGITLDASAFVGGAGSIPLEIAVQASDERGRPVAAARQNGTVQLPAGGGTNVFVELQTYLTLTPGDYELRSAVTTADGSLASSVFTHITVPAYDEDRLALSDVVLGTRENAGSLPDGALPLPIVPTTARVFTEGQTAWAFLRAYRRTGSDTDRQPTPVGVDVSLLDSSGKRVKQQSLSEASFADGAADVRVPLPLKGLASGRYVLRIDAKQDRAQVSRSVAFDVAQAPPTLTQQYSPELRAALIATARYLEGYEHRISAIGAEEEYEQSVASNGGTVSTGDARSRLNSRDGTTMAVPTTTLTRRTRANIMTLNLGARGWITFRDVFEHDGRPVRGHVERLSRILQKVSPDSLQQARQIAEESARYNLNPAGTRVDRTTNVPMAALYFLRAANQPRSAFSLGKPVSIAGVMCTTLQFVEQSRPRLIRTSDDASAKGTFWIDMTNGARVVKTELRIESAVVSGQTVRAQTAVTYSHVQNLDLWLPIEMNETYELTATHQTLTGHASYSDFREFRVTTSEGIK